MPRQGSVMTLFTGLIEGIKKIIGLIVFILGLSFTGFQWHRSELQAVENKVITTVKEYRTEDMTTLRIQLDDIKEDLRDIKKIMMERKP